MRRVVVRAQAAVQTGATPDSASQVTRATLGLREMLLRGELRPGQRISEIPLSAKLGVSRTPLRLAFERLEHEGLVKALPHSGFAASEFTLTDIWDAIETRGILEGASARLAAERLESPLLLEPLRKINRVMEEIPGSDAETFTQYMTLNERFHLAVFDLSKNQSLRRALDAIYRFPFVAPNGRVIVQRSVPGWVDLRPIAQEHHRALVDAIERREGARAESLAREHCRITRRHLEKALVDRSFLETMPGARLIKLRSVDQN
jgi:GntR family transcriptional regulator, vanillate catabolism transcriptional regulator